MIPKESSQKNHHRRIITENESKGASEMAEYNTVEELKAPLLAAVGAADLALATVNEILSNLRDRADVAGDRMDDRRAALTRLQEKLPKRPAELREKLSTEELRRAAEEFLDDATETYNSLVERGEAAIDRLMGQQDFKEAADRVEGYVDQAVELTQEALGNVSAQTRAVGERAAKLVGVDLPVKKTPARKAIKKAVKAVKKAPARKAPAKKTVKKAIKKAVKKAPARKAPAKKAIKKVVARKAPARKAPARKAPARAVKRTVKKTVKRAPAKRVTQK
jgi:heparin binding hemagglutinin HbhA